VNFVKQMRQALNLVDHDDAVLRGKFFGNSARYFATGASRSTNP
jgi:hypothetical protein